jgi:hypothetical protein
MPTGDRGGLKAAFTGFKGTAEKEAEVKLLGRAAEEAGLPQARGAVASAAAPAAVGGLTPRPLLQREPVRQLSFRCPVSLALRLRRKAAFNQLEQQEIIVEGLKRVLAELADPPEDWQG